MASEATRRQLMERTRRALEEAGWVVTPKGETYWIAKDDAFRGVYLSKDGAIAAYKDGVLPQYAMHLWEGFHGRSET